MTMPEIVLPHSIPTMGTCETDRSEAWLRARRKRNALYCSGIQNGFTDIAKRTPIIDTGIVDPNILTRTVGN